MKGWDTVVVRPVAMHTGKSDVGHLLRLAKGVHNAIPTHTHNEKTANK